MPRTRRASRSINPVSPRDETFCPFPDQNRGFGFVQFFTEEDAAAAMDNMDGAELEGRVSDAWDILGVK